MSRHRLARDLLGLILAKLLALSLLYALCFSPAHRIDPAAHIAAALFSPSR